LAVLHWRLFGSDDKPLDAPFVGIHENQVADSLAQTALKSSLSTTAKVLYVGSPKRHAEFFDRADATLSTKVDTKKAIRCEVGPGTTTEACQGIVAAKLKGQSMSQPWIVIGPNDSFALGAAKALSTAGAKDILAFGVGTTKEAQKAWEDNAPWALNASILLNPYPEVKTLARVLSKWEQSGGKSKAIMVGGTVTQKDTYASLIKGMIVPAAGDR
jgi:ABC-type sugar transport system substrate-binding protein